jgi:hypothetical protein
MATERAYFGIMCNVLDWNQPALQFFESAGAAELTDRKTLCLKDVALQRMAISQSVPTNRAPNAYRAWEQ